MDQATSNIVAKWFQKKYQFLDKQMIPYSMRCIVGCDSCCHQSVEILNWEVPLISNYIVNNLSIDQKLFLKKQLKLWFDYFDLRMPIRKVLRSKYIFDTFHKQVAKDKIPCLFLEEKKCIIYPVRPLSCRLHVGINGPENCKENPLNDTIPEAEELRKKVLSDILLKLPTTLTLLNFAIAPLFSLEHRIPKFEEVQLEPTL
ncbi:MAG: YkgJ family cysteine cluster protein [Prolixibacteraceae bacterium]|jgi:Fe-S-cluster containining protein|nr:YkgJ family cysteine cluster protein [Prolixibacteraceae bacterium]